MQSRQTSEQVFSPSNPQQLQTNSTIGQLSLTHAYLSLGALGKEATRIFTDHPTLPGILLIDDGQLMGMISRQRFLTQMSRPYSLELFLERPLSALYPFIQSFPLTLSHNTLIVEAAKQALQRQTELLYEPVVVHWESNNFQVLDIHQLLIAQSDIHRLTTQLLNEKTQAHLIQTEKMSSLGRMVAGVSHEIKNPVNCVSGNLEFLKRYVDDLFQLITAYQETDGSSDSRIKALEKKIDLEFLQTDLPKLFESMSMASERLVDIVSSLRNFSRMDHENKQYVDIHRYLDGTLLILDGRIKLGISVTKEYGDLPLIECYPGQLSQVFINIISNSVDALLEKESALKINQSDNISADSDEWYPMICISTNHRHTQHSGEVIIQIWDNGYGIPKSVQDKIFDPFFTTKSVDNGTGLGLSISHQIVTQKHGGRIHVDSSQTTGTLFEIVLPC